LRRRESKARGFTPASTARRFDVVETPDHRPELGLGAARVARAAAADSIDSPSSIDVVIEADAFPGPCGVDPVALDAPLGEPPTSGR
jgi:hypothetical protein